ncbi:1-deoxy-D-xylulose 5-phosphate reductoisomerase, partial [Bacillus wiedmannii]
LLHSRQKAPRNQEFQHPPVLNEPLPLLIYLAPVTRTVGHFAPSCEAKSASSSGAPMPSCSEQVTSALKSIIDSRTRVASKRVFLVLCRCLVVGQMSFRHQSFERFPCLFSVRLASFRSLS